MYKRILVPTDGSKLSDKAVKEAAKLAKLAGADLLLLHVRPPYDRPLYTEGSSLAYPSRRKDKEREEKEEHDILHSAAKISDAMDVTTETTYVTSTSPYEAIVKTAKKGKCDLIVMSSHGRRGIAGLLIGSETQKVLTHTTIPVLVVR
jgi:nucleotide-binding universal stress UspA family protein